jgi:hypothetical protein
MMKHLLLLVTLLVGCSLDDSEAASEETGGSMAATTAGSPATRQSTTSSSKSTQPSAAGSRAPIMSVQPPTAGTRAPTPTAGASAPATSTAGAPASSTAGAPASSTAGAPATGVALCETLERCCPALSDPTLRSTCEGVAKARAESACAQITPMLCSSNQPQEPSCGTLTTCCATLEEEDQEDCQSVVDEADPAACTEAQAELCPATSTTPGTMTDDCPKLMICCTSLTDDEDQEECLEVVADADAAACGESLTELCPDPNAPPPPESDD